MSLPSSAYKVVLLLRNQLSQFEPARFLQFLFGHECAQFVPCGVVVRDFMVGLGGGFSDLVLLLKRGGGDVRDGGHCVRCEDRVVGETLLWFGSMSVHLIHELIIERLLLLNAAAAFVEDNLPQQFGWLHHHLLDWRCAVLL